MIINSSSRSILLCRRSIKLKPLLFSFSFAYERSVLKTPAFLSLGFKPKYIASMEPSSQPLVLSDDKINLTAKEHLIFHTLLQVVNHFRLHTQLRVAGGWVRDKLLGKECYDIDVALDNMLGREFCDKVNEYLTSTGEKAQGIGVIQCNPGQSKHLETARMRLFDLWIDFVNLRSEDYCENSRIPTMRFGTAKDDAFRRDLTINSLFYNINTTSVEDFTGRGIADLKSGKIVTPLKPKETFLDDPLRVLRAIRFGARFGFILVDELKVAASDEDVKSAIADKISRERIGHEIDLMVSGNQPVKAIQCISDLELFWVVFSVPPEVDPCTSKDSDRCCVAYMDSAWSLMQLLGCSTFIASISTSHDEHRRLALYSTLFLPLRDTVYIDNKSKKVPVVNYIFRNALKLKASDAETVINVHNATRKFISLIPSIVSNNGDLQTNHENVFSDVPVTSNLRIVLGLFLREIKEFWRVALLAAMLLYPSGIESSALSVEKQLELEKRIETFKTVERTVMELGLENVWEMKPLVNGKEIMNVLELKTGAPLVREWQHKLLEWQLAHPSGTSEECLDWMKETHSKRARLV